MTTLCFNSVENDPYITRGQSVEEQRAQQIIQQILDYGVDAKYVFKPDDLIKKTNTPKVIRCLEEVAKLVMEHEKVKAFFSSSSQCSLFLFSPRRRPTSNWTLF